MSKEEFLNRLNQLLMSLPSEERERMKVYYDEIIEDYIENGFSEEEAVAKLGSVGAVAEEILKESKSVIVTKEKMSGGAKVGITTLLVLGSPLWGALLLAALAILLAFYIVLCVPVIICGAFAVAFLAVSIIGIIGTPFLLFESVSMAAMQFGVGVMALGISGISTVLLIQSIKLIKNGTKISIKGIAKLFKSRVVRG